MRPQFRPTWEIGASLGLHVSVVLAILLGSWLSPNPGPMINPTKVMQVSAVALPKSNKALPDRPTRTPDQPPAESAPKTRSPHRRRGPTRRRRRRTQATWPCVTRTRPKKRAATRPRPQQGPPEASWMPPASKLCSGTWRPALGDQDRTRTDPNGVDPQDAIFGAPGAGTMDPELARYITACRNVILPNWTPMPATLASHPEYQVILLVTVSPQGELGQPTVVQGSGDAAFDRTALLAVRKTGRLPPPPQRFVQSAGEGVQITLHARDLQ